MSLKFLHCLDSCFAALIASCTVAYGRRNGCTFPFVSVLRVRTLLSITGKYLYLPFVLVM